MGCALTLANGAGQSRMVLNTSAQGGAISLVNALSNNALTLGVSAQSGGGYMDIANAQGVRVLSAAAETDACGRLDIADSAGRFVFSVDAIADTGAILALRNSGGKRAFMVGTRPEGGLMNIFNQYEVPVFVAGYGEGSLGGAMSIKNGRGMQVFHAAADVLENGELTLFDAEGRRPRTLRPAQ